MWLVVGLGNPGAKYLFTRHNIGFMALDNFVTGAGGKVGQTERKCLVTRFKMDDQELLLAKPQTFMNLSGEPVKLLLDYYKIDLAKLIVIQDDIDQPFASIRLQKNRGPGGHNGIKSISEKLASSDYLRVKLGVGRPPHPKMDVADYVLQNFAPEEKQQLGDFLNVASDALEALIFDGYDKAATQFNRSGTESLEQQKDNQ